MAVGAQYHGQVTVGELQETLETYRQQGAAVAVG
jgi:hypothetical protein